MGKEKIPMRIKKDQIIEMERHLEAYDKGTGVYAHAFIRLSQMEEEISYEGMYKKDLKNLYMIKRLVNDSHLSFNRDFDKDLERQIDKNITALVMIAYMKKKNWDEVGLCANCYGRTYVGSSDPYSHCGDTESCDCDFNYIEGWQLKRTIYGRKIKSDYEYKLLNTESMLKILMAIELSK